MKLALGLLAIFANIVFLAIFAFSFLDFATRTPSFTTGLQASIYFLFFAFSARDVAYIFGIAKEA